jgi:hypothetical protein
VGVWLFGVQRATREIWRALEHMPEGLPAKRPRPADIATLSKGQFYVCFGREMYKVYVQPAWMTAAHAEAIARGEEEVESAREILREYATEHKSSPREMSKHHEPARTDTDPGRDRQPAQPQTASAGTAARDARPVAPDDDPEETMWKEKYEALHLEYAKLLGQKGKLERESERGQHSPDVNGDRVAFNPLDPRDVNDLLDVLLTRLRTRKDPAIIALLREVPEIAVTVKRRTLEMSDESTDGRIALLISQKFFDAPQDGGTITKEFKRRGWFDQKSSNAAVIKPLAKITEMGFLIRDGNQYQAVPGMKVHIQEAK